MRVSSVRQRRRHERHEQAAQMPHDAYGDTISDVELSLLADEIVRDLEERFAEVVTR